MRLAQLLVFNQTSKCQLRQNSFPYIWRGLISWGIIIGFIFRLQVDIGQDLRERGGGLVVELISDSLRKQMVLSKVDQELLKGDYAYRIYSLAGIFHHHSLSANIHLHFSTRMSWKTKRTLNRTYRSNRSSVKNTLTRKDNNGIEQ